MRTVRIVEGDASAALLLDPTRRDLLTRLGEPGSASSLARRIGLPRQKVNYHLRELEKAGFVELVEERRKGNCVERLVRATARAYLVSPAAIGVAGLPPEEVRDRFSATYLIATAARAIGELSALRARAEATGKRLATLTLETRVRFRSAQERTAYAEELANALAALAARYDDPTAPHGRTFEVVVAAWPATSAASGPEKEP